MRRTCVLELTHFMIQFLIFCTSIINRLMSWAERSVAIVNRVFACVEANTFLAALLAANIAGPLLRLCPPLNVSSTSSVRERREMQVLFPLSCTRSYLRQCLTYSMLGLSLLRQWSHRFKVHSVSARICALYLWHMSSILQINAHV